MALKTGIIIRVDSRVSHVEVDGVVYLCSVRGRHFEATRDQKRPVAVGDRVDVDLATDPGVIETIHPRRSKLSRRTSGEGKKREQVLVANLDQVVVVASCRRPRFSSTFVDRVLCAAEMDELAGVICLNKIDLAGEGFVESVRATYEPLGYRIVPTSCETEEGLEAIADCLRDKISVLTGLSGVGKSTLLNRLDPSLELVVRKVSSKWETGRHTTTFSQMLRLPLPAWVVDTPGVRQFNILGLQRRELAQLFPEMRDRASDCAFQDCMHLSEPGCAISAAREAEEIAASRFASYERILEDI